MVELLNTNGLNSYILTFDDFINLPDILQQADAILIYPGTDLPPKYYKEENLESHTHKDSYTTYIF